MTKLDMPQLIKQGWELMELHRPKMAETGDIEISFLIYSDAGIDIVVVPQPDVANDPDKKHAMMKVVRRRCAEQKAFCVFAIMDTYTGKYVTPNGEPLTDEDRRVIKEIERIGSAEAARLGIIAPRREAMVVQVNTPLASALLIQYYRREGQTIVWEETEEQKAEFSEDSIIRSRMSGYFDYMNERQA